jgi:predicted regulator of amino acid metabolism with ACT domain
MESELFPNKLAISLTLMEQNVFMSMMSRKTEPAENMSWTASVLAHRLSLGFDVAWLSMYVKPQISALATVAMAESGIIVFSIIPSNPEIAHVSTIRRTSRAR